jgi:hypothetical protein
MWNAPFVSYQQLFYLVFRHLFSPQMPSQYVFEALRNSAAVFPAIETHWLARGTFPEDKLRLTGFAGLPPHRFGTHSPTVVPLELCGALELLA